MRTALLTSTLIHAGAFAVALGIGVFAAGAEPARALWVTAPGASTETTPALAVDEAEPVPEPEAVPAPAEPEAADLDLSDLEAHESAEPVRADATPETAGASVPAPERRRLLDAVDLHARIRSKPPSPTTPGARAEAPPPAAAASVPGSLAAEALESENVPPPYPPAARRAKQEGTVWLELDLDAQGTVQQAIVACTSGHALLDAAALTTVRSWRYRPALEAGRPVASRLRQPVVFRLTDAP